jgi:hypothetical protein
MKTVNPQPLEKLRNVGDTVLKRFALLVGGLTFSAAMVLLFFGGALYAMLAGFAAAAGVVHLFDGPHALAIILGIVFSLMAIQSGAGMLLFFAAFFGAVYAWDWSWPIALIVFLPGLALIPLGFLAAAALAVKASLFRR